MRWQTVAPLYSAEKLSDRIGSIDLGNNVVLRKKPAWLDLKESLENLGYAKTTMIRVSKVCLFREYDAQAPDQGAIAAFSVANLSLWLARPTAVRFDTGLHAMMKEKDEKWDRLDSASYAPLVPQEEYESLSLSTPRLRTAGRYNGLLTQSEGAVRIASNVLWEALTQRSWPIRYLMLWVGLEALFGADTEISFRLGQRMALFLHSNLEDRRTLFKRIRDKNGLYDIRSKLVHGVSIRLKDDEGKKAMCDSEMLLRKSLRQILDTDEYLRTFSSEDTRGKFLNDLALQ